VINKVLSFIKEELNNYIKLKLNDSSVDKVVCAEIVAQDGSAVHLPQNSIIITLANIEEEKVLKSQTPHTQELNGSLIISNPEIKLNLYILFIANFGENYNESLKFLSFIIQFFQAKNVFNPQNSPTLNPEIKKLVLELYILNFEQLNHLWGTLGAKYKPSVMYKVRFISIQEEVGIKKTKRSEIINQNFTDK